MLSELGSVYVEIICKDSINHLIRKRYRFLEIVDKTVHFKLNLRKIDYNFLCNTIIKPLLFSQINLKTVSKTSIPSTILIQNSTKIGVMKPILKGVAYQR